VGLADISQFLAEPSAEAVHGWERSLTAEILSRHDALAEVRCRLGVGPERTRGATAIEVHAVRDLADLRAAFDLAGAQLPEPIDSGDHRIDDLVRRLPADQRLMVVATAEGNVVGGALALLNDNGTVTLRIIGVIPAFRHRGTGRRLVERSRRRLAGSARAPSSSALTRRWGLGITSATRRTCCFQWVYDADLYETETDPMLAGPSLTRTSGARRSMTSPAVRRAR
jgi:GNAT superfamily N-acetyltransferase